VIPGLFDAPENTHAFVAELLGEDAPMTRVMSPANGVVGVLHAAALGIHAIGRGLADALDLDPKHAVKQVDRLLSNTGIKIWDWFAQWVTFVRDEEQPVATGCSSSRPSPRPCSRSSGRRARPAHSTSS